MRINYMDAQELIDTHWDSTQPDGGLDDGVLDRLLDHDFRYHPLECADSDYYKAAVEVESIITNNTEGDDDDK